MKVLTAGNTLPLYVSLSQEILNVLELDPIRDQIVGLPNKGLSQEERKRVTIGVEVMFEMLLLLLLMMMMHRYGCKVKSDRPVLTGLTLNHFFLLLFYPARSQSQPDFPRW